MLDRKTGTRPHSIIAMATLAGISLSWGMFAAGVRFVLGSRIIIEPPVMVSTRRETRAVRQGRVIGMGVNRGRLDLQ